MSTHAPRSLRPRPAALAALAALLIAPLVLLGCQPAPDDASAQSTVPAGQDAVPVRTADVVEENRALPIRTSGRLAKKAEMTLSFKIGGFVETIRFDEGDRVRKGQILARLDLDEINARVKRAEAALAKAKRDLERARALFRDSVATLEEKQNAQTAVDVAEAELEEAQFNRQHATIVAPADGRIQRRMAEENEQVAPGAPVFEFGAETEGWVMRVGLADEDVVQLRLGSPAEVRFDAFPEETFNARVTEIADAADPISGTFEVELQIADPEDRLKSGLIGTVDLRPADSTRYFFVPTAALVEGDGNLGVVYALTEDALPPSRADSTTARPVSAVTSDSAALRRVERRSVRIERILGDEVAIRSGLEGVREVVTYGGAYLRDGSWARPSAQAPGAATLSDATTPNR